MKWFRLYDEFQHDTKLRRMPIPHRYAFVILLCMANRSSVRGVILNLDDEDLAFELEMQTEDWLTLKAKFRAKGLIEPVQGGVKITNWDNRQFASDSSAERVAAYRRKKTERDCNVTPPLLKRDCNALDTDTDSYPDPEQTQNKSDPDPISIAENQPVKSEAQMRDLDSAENRAENDAKSKKPRRGRKSSGGALATASAVYPATFDAWWNSYRQMCLMVDAEPGSKKEAGQEWEKCAEVYESQRFQDADWAYAEYVGRQFQKKGEVFGISHGCRYLKSAKWQDALDRVALSQKAGVDLSNPVAVKSAAATIAKQNEWAAARVALGIENEEAAYERF